MIGTGSILNLAGKIKEARKELTSIQQGPPISEFSHKEKEISKKSDDMLPAEEIFWH